MSGVVGVLKYTMKTKTANCDACNDTVNPDDLTSIAGDAICPTCVEACDDHYSMDDDLDYGDSSYGDDSWVDLHDGWADQYDDDPNPYHGTYSEM